MPAIRLRSDQNTLRSACDPHSNQPSIRLRSVAITLLLCPLIPRADRSPALGRGAQRFSVRKKGREGGEQKGPRQPAHTNNPETPERGRIETRWQADRQPLRPCAEACCAQDLPSEPAEPKANLLRQRANPVMTPHEQITVSRVQPGRRRATVFAHTVPTRRRPHLAKAGFAGPPGIGPHDGKSRGGGFRARTAETPLALILGRKARQPGRRRSVQASEMAGKRGDHLSRSRGVGGGIRRSPVYRPIDPISRRPPKNSAAARC
jgi:hypothetical protein